MSLALVGHTVSMLTFVLAKRSHAPHNLMQCCSWSPGWD